MEKVILDITSTKFTAADPLACSLRLLVSMDGIAFLVADANREILCQKSYEFAAHDPINSVRRVAETDPQLQVKYGSTYLAFQHKNATLIPIKLFDAAQLPSYFQLLLRQEASYSYFFEDLPSCEAKMVYAVDTSLVQLCEQYFPGAKIQNAATSLLSHWQKNAKRSDFEVFVNLRNHHGQLAVFDRKHLQFFNSFSFTKASDCFYFILLAFEQFQLNPQEIPLNVSGELLEESEVFKLLYRYVRYIKFAETSPHYQLPGSMEALPAHFNLDLYCLN